MLSQHNSFESHQTLFWAGACEGLGLRLHVHMHDPTLVWCSPPLYYLIKQLDKAQDIRMSVWRSHVRLIAFVLPAALT